MRVWCRPQDGVLVADDFWSCFSDDPVNKLPGAFEERSTMDILSTYDRLGSYSKASSVYGSSWRDATASGQTCIRTDMAVMIKGSIFLAVMNCILTMLRCGLVRRYECDFGVLLYVCACILCSIAEDGRMCWDLWMI